MRRAARTDRNHRPLFDFAREFGAYVCETHQLGQGKPDGFVYAPRKHSWFAVEIKTEDGELTPDQVRVHALAPVKIWRTEGDVLETLGLKARQHRPKVETFVEDGYRRCAFDGCRKIIPDDADEGRKYCRAVCNDRARRQRAAESAKG